MSDVRQVIVAYFEPDLLVKQDVAINDATKVKGRLLEWQQKLTVLTNVPKLNTAVP